MLDKIMKKQKKNIVRIKPKYIKNAHGKTLEVYLDVKAYESLLNRMKEFEAIKKDLKTSCTNK